MDGLGSLARLMNSAGAEGSRATFKALFWLYFSFKVLPILVGGTSIYLGYRLFILGVTGQASLSIASKSVTGQLINAAPGLFFGIGGMVVVIIATWRGVSLSFNDGVGDRRHETHIYKSVT